jgi:hypothetical protein
VTVTAAGAEEAVAAATTPARGRSTSPLESQDAAPSPAWGRDLLG